MPEFIQADWTCIDMIRKITSNERTIAPTHKCVICGALWRCWGDGADTYGDSWSLVSDDCESCCDNSPMERQIVPVTISEIVAAISHTVMKK